MSAQPRELRVFPFLGAEPALRDGDLQQMAFDGYTLLALDALAMLKAVNAGVPCTTLSDWLNETDFLRIEKTAKKCQKNWFLPARHMFCVDGVCFAEIDSLYRMGSFWRDALTALALAEQFKARHVKELRFFHNNAIQELNSYRNMYSICSRLWEMELPEIARPELRNSPGALKQQTPLWKRLRRYVKRKISSLFESGAQKCSDANHGRSHYGVAGRIVLLCQGSSEIYRFSPLLKQLLSSFPGEIAFALSKKPSPCSLKFLPDESFPVAYPSQAPPPLDHQRQFLEAYEYACMCCHEDDPWYTPLRSLDMYFRLFCTKLWPEMVTSFEFWSKLWTREKPRLILGTSLQFVEIESFLAIEAARRAGIPTFAVPHSGITVIMVELWEKLRSAVLCEFPIQKAIFKRYGVPEEYLVGCCGTLPPNAYSSISSSTEVCSKDTWRVLVLVNPINYSLWPTVPPRAHLEALHILNTPPEEIAAHISLKIKVHPGYPEQGWFSSVGKHLSDAVLAADTDLKSCLADNELVVFINAFGTSILHTLTTGKAIIFLQTANISHLRYLSLFYPAGTLTNTHEEFWTSVQKFFIDPGVAENMKKRTLEFCWKNGDGGMYPSINTILHDLLKQGETS